MRLYFKEMDPNGQTIKTDPHILHIRLPKCGIPLALVEPLKKKLASLQKGLITLTKTSTEWIRIPLVLRKHSGKQRICIDPKPLNRALRSHYTLPVTEETLLNLSRETVISRLSVGM